MPHTNACFTVKPKFNILPQKNFTAGSNAVRPPSVNAWSRPLATHSNPVPPTSDTPTATYAAPARPARGRRMNATNRNGTNPIRPEVPKMSGPPSAASTTSGWGNVSDGPWGSGPNSLRNNNNDNGWGSVTKKKGKAKAPSSVASSGGWGHVSNGPWAGSRAPSARKDDDDDNQTIAGANWSDDENGGGKANNKSWADQVDDEYGNGGDVDDGKSVASSKSGWGTVSNGPWGA